ncbi:MAG: DUF5675 family protein [Flavobacteriaceae bacterium]|nr:DUF5675 family protein [Flavobacteriaceae bacterium]
MEKVVLQLFRSQFQEGTYGALFLDGEFICFMIELPWRDNQRRISCIPDGNYPIQKRYTPKFKNHLLVEHVPNRSGILIHPANNALKELLGCLAPVSNLFHIAKGYSSRMALEHLLKKLAPHFKEGKSVELEIQSKDWMTKVKNFNKNIHYEFTGKISK